MPAAYDPLPALPVGLRASVTWSAAGRLGPQTRRELTALLAELAPALSDLEAAADDAARRVSCGLEWLLPRLEVTLPLYGRGRVFRLRIQRREGTDMVLLTRSGRRVGTVHLSR